jgi:hypothetical protein
MATHTVRGGQVFCRCIVSLALIGCAATPSRDGATPETATSSPLVLSDAMLAGKKGDLDGLYAAWLEPFIPKNEDYIPLASKEQQVASVEAINDGFQRFCKADGGVVSAKLDAFGAEYSCAAAGGAFAGRITVVRMAGNMLHVTYDSPQRVQARAAAQQNFEKRQARNGPTGWLVTDRGKVKFLRLGTLADRHVVEVELDDSGQSVPIEEIARIDFHASCCDFDVTLKDGRTATRNSAKLRHRRAPNMASTYGAGEHGFPVVIVDAESGQPYTRLFSNLKGVKSIELDPNVASWDALPGGSMRPSQLASQSSADRYTQRLRERAKQLHTEAMRTGSIKLLPDGKLTPQLSKHLELELNALASASACEGDDVVGLADLETFAQCRVAARERKLVIGDGYSLAADVTPLSTIIVLEKISRDLR